MENLVYGSYIRGLNHKLYLAGVYMTDNFINIRILGESHIVYDIEINKITGELYCQCEHFYKNKYPCKHICFILFKVFPIFKNWLKPRLPILIDRRFFPHTSKINYTFLECKLSKGEIKLLIKKIRQNYNKYINPRLYEIDNIFHYYNNNHKKILKKFNGYPDECIICLDITKNDLKCDTCKANFHEKCIYEWLSVNPICPHCRSNLEILRFVIYAKKYKRLKLTKNQYNYVCI